MVGDASNEYAVEPSTASKSAPVNTPVVGLKLTVPPNDPFLTRVPESIRVSARALLQTVKDAKSSRKAAFIIGHLSIMTQTYHSICDRLQITSFL
jgi:hypothetical protein